MEKKFISFALVVIAGVVIGVLIVGKQAKDPVLKQILDQQQQILKAQERIEGKLAGSTETDDPNRKLLDQRIALLENQIKILSMFLQGQGGANAPQRPSGPPAEDLSKVYDIPILHSAVRGNPKALVTITEFVDIQCPFCSRFHGPIVEVLKAYPDQVKYVMKNFPLSFHPQAKPAAIAALAAGEQGKFWEMVDDFLENNKDLSDARIEETAKKIGLDMAKFKKDMDEKYNAYEEIINKDMELGESVMVQGTPTFYINGKKTNARDLASFKREIDAILSAGK